MFGFSLTKLLVLALIIGAVLLVFRVLGQRGRPEEVSRNKTKAFDTEYDAESDTFVVRDDEKDKK